MGASNGKPEPPPVRELNSIQAMDNLIENNEIVVIGFFKDPESTPAKCYLSATSVFHDYTFAITDNETVFTFFDVKEDTVIVFTQFDKKRKFFDGEKTEENFKKFIHIYSLPVINEYNNETLQQIMKSPIKSHLLLFISKNAGHIEKYIDPLKNLAERYRERLLFLTVDSDEELEVKQKEDDQDDHNDQDDQDDQDNQDDHDNQVSDELNIFKTLEVTKRNIPTVRFVKYENKMLKYKPYEETEMNVSPTMIEILIQKFFNGKLQRLLMSQELPEDWDENPLQILVASNFNDVAFDLKKDVFVEFYAPWCGQCKFVMRIFEQLAEKYKNDESVVIAKMNASRNELENLNIPFLPHMKLIRKGDNKIFDYTYRWTLEDFIEFIETRGEWGESADA